MTQISKLPYKFGRYVLKEKIAEGGMAEIFRGKYKGDRGFAKDVAIKRILPHWSNRPEFEKMLVDEANAVMNLQHQNIVQVFELGKDGDCSYISMEYIDGVDLKRLSKKSEKKSFCMPEKYALFIICEILRALDFAHKRVDERGDLLNIVHRDVSPQNILISYNGEVKLTDFGIAKGLHRNKETTTARLIGKYAYMSPEQAFGEDIDFRSDLYSVGIILFEILTGDRLFYSKSDFEIIQKVRDSRMPDFWEHKVSLNMRGIINKALSKDRNSRYLTAAEFLKDLNEYIGMKKLHTYGLELAEYINDLFIDEKHKKQNIPLRCSQRTKVIKKKRETGCVLNSVKSRMFVYCFLALFVLMLGMGKKAVGDIPKMYRKYENNFAFAPIQKSKKDKNIPEIMNEGILNIDSEPTGAGAVVEYNGVKKSFKTPFVLTDPDLSKNSVVRLSLNHKGYNPIHETIKLDSDTPHVLKKYHLKSSVPGTLSVQARPWGYVYIPDVISKRESPVGRVSLKPGVHKVKVHYAPSNKWLSAKVDIKPGKNHRCYADFTKQIGIVCK